MVSDPVDVASGQVFLWREDVTFPGRTPYTFKRQYWSAPKNFQGLRARAGRALLEPVPKPFGAAPGDHSGALWIHNLFSLVAQGPSAKPKPDGGFESGVIMAADVYGRVLSFVDCQGDGCVLTNHQGSAAGSGSQSQRERMIKGTPGGPAYILVQDSRRFEYGALWSGLRRSAYFLTRIADGSNQTIATVAYHDPATHALVVDGQPCMYFQGADAGVSDFSSGAPYIRTVTAGNGTVYDFKYRRMTGANGTECVLDRIEQGGAPVIRYDYAAGGLLSKATQGDGGVAGTTETYSNFDAGFGVAGPEGVIVYALDSTGKATAIYGPGPGQVTTLQTTDAGVTAVAFTGNIGPFDDVPVTHSANYVVGNAYGHLSPRVESITEQCGNGAICVSSTETRLWSNWTNPQSIPGDEGGMRSESGAFNLNRYATVGDRLELTAVQRGMTGTDAGVPLEETRYAYTYGAPFGPGDAGLTQLLSQETRKSVVAGSTDVDVSTKTFYLADNRVRATIQGGYTRVLDGGVEPRFVATFRFYSDQGASPCEIAKEDTDTFVEIHGPCYVGSDSESVEDCPGTAFPVSATHYYSNGNVHKTVQLPNGCTTAGQLVRTFVQDAYGNTTSETDENNVVTTMTWDGPARRILTKSDPVASGQTTYSYDNGQLAKTCSPDGYCERFCHRDGANCDGAWSPKPLWKAKVNSEGTSWFERVTFTYHADLSVKTEVGYLCNTTAGCALSEQGELRWVRKYSPDAKGNTIREGQGGDVSSRAATAIERIRRYDSSGNLTAIRSPFSSKDQSPPDCETDPTRCNRFDYDLANRLRSVTESFDVSTSQRTCFEHDGAGNTTKVRFGCDAACSACGRENLYEYDDFGRLVRATIAEAAGAFSYEYGTAGSGMTAEDTPVLRAANEKKTYAYDQLGRLVTVGRWVAGTTENLVQYVYDDFATGVCGFYPTNAKGRRAVKYDAFGTTLYQYNARGEVTAERRKRSWGTCSAADVQLTTNYEYDASGHQTAIVYPHGRRVQYLHGPDGRVASIFVSKFNGTSWSVRPLECGLASCDAIRAVEWEPYGGLLRYRVGESTYLQGPSADIEFLAGDTQAALPGAPGACTATAAGLQAGMDKTGLPRALWVSTDGFGGSGDLLKLMYQWRADQVAAEAMCAKQTSGEPKRLQYSYDRQTRLLGAAPNTRSFVGATYTYGGTGQQRTTLTTGGSVLTSNYYQAPLDTQLDWLEDATGGLGDGYLYDDDGRVSEHGSEMYNQWNLPYSLRVAKNERFGYTGRSSVYGTMTVGTNAVYQYFYDGENKRIRKVLPTGAKDEYFYGLGKELLEDIGDDDADPGTGNYAIDEYVWLAGRAVMLIRAPVAITRLRSGAVSTWTRGSDTAATCQRSGETYACGRYFIVNDYLPKPVMLLDSDLRVVNAVQYDPFGHPNRQALVTSVWYEPNANTVIGTCDPKVDAGSSLVYRARVGYHSFDMEPNVDYLRYRDTAGTELGSDTGPRGWAWSGWMTPAPADRKVNLVLQSNATNESAVNTQWCEYRASDAGVASPFWIPLRFPGQYWDRESDYFENWNRYYDPWTGRYLQPEPLMAVRNPRALPSYAYALSSPIRVVDPDGRDPMPAIRCRTDEYCTDEELRPVCDWYSLSPLTPRRGASVNLHCCAMVLREFVRCMKSGIPGEDICVAASFRKLDRCPRSPPVFDDCPPVDPSRRPALKGKP